MRGFQSFAISGLLAVSTALSSSQDTIVEEIGSKEMAAKRVAIIGAGAAGSSTAYHLAKFAKEDGVPVEITVFERNNYIGGRTTTVKAWNNPQSSSIELGGSIFVKINHIMYNASKEFGLASKSHGDGSDTKEFMTKGMPDLGVWNGKEFVVVVSAEGGWWEKAKLLWKYGTAPIRTNALMRETVERFLKMYEEPVFPWASLNEAAEEVDLRKVTGVTGEQFLKSKSIGDLFANEIIQASTRVNYAQNLGVIHGLETMVCMATDGAIAIQGGNWKIFATMLEKADVTKHLSTNVKKIEKQPDGTYLLTSSDPGLTSTNSAFDSVVIAAPLQFSDLGIDFISSPPDQPQYVALHVTLFASPHKLDPTAFGLKPEEAVPQAILSTLPPGENHGSNLHGVGTPGIFSISIVATDSNPNSEQPRYRQEYIYKIFSPEPVNATYLSHVLGKDVPEDIVSPNGAVTWFKHKLWHSYPYELPRVTFEEIKLDTDLWYTAGIESFISTMETSALMGKNVAKLMVKEWSGSKGSKNGASSNSAGESIKLQEEQPQWEFAGFDNEEQKPIKAKL